MSDIASNRRALHDFHILDRYEAGIELKGTEVKSIRSGLATLNGAFARVENGEVWLYGADIQPYIRASVEQHEPKRQRRLLLHAGEINKLFEATTVGGHALVALRMYWKGPRVKVEIGVAQGKQAHDKRADIKQKTETREAAREAARFNRKHA
ncbi:MAG TPA: SsrA-binding protein SmpB [Chthoniobacteraceae bacterium]|jgi:SsrA-binding protein|nr:SsrA-binding protein SmpB [Chthoniobacteraceae bacterium]